MRVTQKGQVTIPKVIRDKLGIRPGSEVDFVDEGEDGVRVVKSGGASARRPEDFDAWLTHVQGTIDLQGKTVDTVIHEMRGERDDLDAG